MKKFAIVPAIFLASAISSAAMAGNAPAPGASSAATAAMIAQALAAAPDAISNVNIDDGVTSFNLTTEQGNFLVTYNGSNVTITNLRTNQSQSFSVEELLG